MLDLGIFEAGIAELKLLGLGGGPEGAEGAIALYRHVQTVPSDVFADLIDVAAKTCDFFPRPKWFLENAADRRRPELQKALPYAEPESTPAICPAHVRRWMQLQVKPSQDAAAVLRSARRSAFSRLHAKHLHDTGKRLQSATPAMMDAVERDPNVIAARNSLMPRDGYTAGMAAVKQSMTAEDEAELTYEFKIEDEAAIASVSLAADEAAEDW